MYSLPCEIYRQAFRFNLAKIESKPDNVPNKSRSAGRLTKIHLTRASESRNGHIYRVTGHRWVFGSRKLRHTPASRAFLLCKFSNRVCSFAGEDGALEGGRRGRRASLGSPTAHFLFMFCSYLSINQFAKLGFYDGRDIFFPGLP